MKKIATLFITSLLCMAAQAQGLGPAHARVNGTPLKKQTVTLGQLQERGLVRKAARSLDNLPQGVYIVNGKKYIR